MVAGWQRMDEERIAGCSADRRCRERSELEGVMPPSRYKRLESNIALPEGRPSGLNRPGQCPIAISEENARASPQDLQEGRALKSPPFLDPKDPYFTLAATPYRISTR